MADRDPAGRTLGDYILHEQIGEGGYGAVYRGEQPLLKREVVVKDSQRRIQRARWICRSLVVLAAVAVVGGFLYRATTQALRAQLAQEQARSAKEVAEAIVTRADLEQGRLALIHDEPGAWPYLDCVYQRGGHLLSTVFVSDRALQPRLAEQARLASTSGRMWSAAFSPDAAAVATAAGR